MILTLLSALILGLIIGPLARLILPGKQDVSLVMTVLIGAVGALIGSTVVSTVSEGSGFNLWALVTGVGVAVLLVLLYGVVTGRGSNNRR